MKLLIVDDDKSTRSILSEMSQQWGYEVILAADGESGWRILDIIDEPIILLVDWIMPGLDGIELCRRIKQSSKATQAHVIMVTGQKNNMEDLVTGFDAGADDFLNKPIDPRELSCRLSVGKRILTYQHELEQRNAALHETTQVMENILRELNTVNAKLNALSTLDELTGVANRRGLEEYLAKEWRHAMREKEVLTLIMIDVDFFKLYNDTYGHQAGDECLKKVASVLADCVKRSADLTARYGGEEFAIVLRTTELQGARKIAESMRCNVEALAIPHAASTASSYVTVSMGIATMTPRANSMYTTLISRADNALYKAKREGRNRCCWS